mmetsp:Transcript_140250/g.244209  ORF Transcript_140250/g.244209 Transcript_140250/m.244209 type:complete len:184 (-) Transcript_140250:18-569(-)
MAASHFQTPSSPPRDDLEMPLMASSNHSLAKEMHAFNPHRDCEAAGHFQTSSAPSYEDLETPPMANGNHSPAKHMQSCNPHHDWIQQIHSVANNSSLARHKHIFAKQRLRFERLYPLSSGEARLSDEGCPTSRETSSTRPAQALPRIIGSATPHIPRHSAKSDLVPHHNSTNEHEHIRSVATS